MFTFYAASSGSLPVVDMGVIGLRFLSASHLLLSQITLISELCSPAAAERHIRDDNESEMILGNPGDKCGSLGVKSALLGSTRYHRVSYRVKSL